jgi:hypothetical protein
MKLMKVFDYNKMSKNIKNIIDDMLDEDWERPSYFSFTIYSDICFEDINNPYDIMLIVRNYLISEGAVIGDKVLIEL